MEVNMSSTRLTDRIESEGPDGGEVVVRRYGMWGTSSEIEVRGKNKYFVVHPNKKEKNFRTLAEAEKYLEECL